MAVPDRDRARALLARHWDDVVRGRAATTVDAETHNRIEELFASEGMSFTYCPLTQLLGKLTDHRLDALCLQRGDDSESHWDPRSFAAAVVVPWVRDNQDVLGTSADPYVSNPLRQPRILSNPPNVRSSSLPLWESLHCVLAAVEERNDPAYTVDVFRAVLAVINDKLQRQQFVIPSSPGSALNRPCFSSAVYSRRRRRASTRCRSWRRCLSWQVAGLVCGTTCGARRRRSPTMHLGWWATSSVEAKNAWCSRPR